MSLDYLPKCGIITLVRHKKCNAEAGVTSTCLLHTEDELHTQPNNRHIAVLIIPPVLLFVQGDSAISSVLCFGTLDMDAVRIQRFFVLYTTGNRWGF